MLLRRWHCYIIANRLECTSMKDLLNILLAILWWIGLSLPVRKCVWVSFVVDVWICLIAQNRHLVWLITFLWHLSIHSWFELWIATFEICCRAIIINPMDNMNLDIISSCYAVRMCTCMRTLIEWCSCPNEFYFAAGHFTQNIYHSKWYENNLYPYCIL